MLLETGERSPVTFTTDEPPGVDCPETNCVVFGYTKKYRRHRGNLDFREMVQEMILLEEANKNHSTTKTEMSARRQTMQLIDKVLEETSKKFIFRTYDAKNCWYRKFDGNELRFQITLAIRNAKKNIEAQAQRGNVPTEIGRAHV